MTRSCWDSSSTSSAARAEATVLKKAPSAHKIMVSLYTSQHWSVRAKASQLFNQCQPCMDFFFQTHTIGIKQIQSSQVWNYHPNIPNVKVTSHDTTGLSNLTPIPITNSKRSHQENEKPAEGNQHSGYQYTKHKSGERFVFHINEIFTQWYSWSQQNHSETNSCQWDQRQHKRTGVNTEGIHSQNTVPDLKEE